MRNHNNIGYIGYASPGMVDVAVDELSLRRKIGSELYHLDLIELVQERPTVVVDSTKDPLCKGRRAQQQQDHQERGDLQGVLPSISSLPNWE